MKPAIFVSRPLATVVLLVMASCGGQNTQETTSRTDTTAGTVTSTTAMPSPAPSAVTTTPQDVMFVRHRVANFNKWMVSYDAHDSMRLANGIHSYVIGRGLKDSNMVLVILKLDDLSKAKSFAKAPSLKQAMQKGGVLGTPMFSYVTMTYQDTSMIGTSLRSRTTFTVKNWASWSGSFDSSRQLRKDNGIADRAFGHDADDDHKVTVIVAIQDTAKAYAFWKSDQLKKMQAASGVVGATDRFLYTLVKRY